MATNQVVPSQDRDDSGPECVFYDPPRYRQTLDMPRLVVRGVLPMEYLELGERFKGCTEPSHIQDILMAEGDYARPKKDPEVILGMNEKELEAYESRIRDWQVSYDQRRKSARERVRKRKART